MRTVKLVIGFIGTRYEGWQSQRKDKTIQEVFEKVLQRILKEPTNIISSSRTDSGVHALGFVAHFKTKSQITDRDIKYALNYYLPSDIVVHSAKTMPMDFHARYHAKSKLYRYDIWNHRTRPLKEAPYALWYPGKLNIAAMRKAASYIKGRQDYKAFQDAGGDERKSTVRHIKKVSITKKKSLIRIEIVGDGFLRHMVRIIVGTLIHAGRGKFTPKDIPAIIASKDRKKAGPTSKAHGLTLVRVNY